MPTTKMSHASMLAALSPNQQPTYQERWLRVAHSSKWHTAIERKEGSCWTSPKGSYTHELLSIAIADPNVIIGIRPENETRCIVIDVDNKTSSSSPYWDKYGKSQQLIALEGHSEAIGGKVSLIRSGPSGGLHCIIALPRAIHCWLAHWLAVELCRRAGMKLAPGRAEAFPSRIDYSTNGEIMRSNGIRLPGQEGSALIAGEIFIQDSDLIYQQLVQDMDDTYLCPEFEEALLVARKLKKKPADSKSFAANSFKNIEWTHCGQSQDHMARLATIARIANPSVYCPHELGKIIRKMALQARGFDRYASANTKRDLNRPANGLSVRWARCSLKKSFGIDWRGREGREGSRPAAVGGDKGGDKHYNKRLFSQSRAKLTRIWKQQKESIHWSKRQIAKAAGMARGTLEKHWEYWVQLVAHTPPNNGEGRSTLLSPAVVRSEAAVNTSKICCKPDVAFIYSKDTCCFAEAALAEALRSKMQSNLLRNLSFRTSCASSE